MEFSKKVSTLANDYVPARHAASRLVDLNRQELEKERSALANMFGYQQLHH